MWRQKRIFLGVLVVSACVVSSVPDAWLRFPEEHNPRAFFYSMSDSNTIQMLMFDANVDVDVDIDVDADA
jgi:hypothetical protein